MSFYVSAAAIAVAVLQVSQIDAAEVEIRFVVKQREVSLGQNAEIAVLHRPIKGQKMIPGPRAIQNRIVATISPKRFAHRSCAMSVAFEGGPTWVQMETRGINRFGPPHVKATADKPFRLDGEFALQPEDSLLPGPWLLHVEDRHKKRIAGPAEVYVRIDRESIPFIGAIVSDSKVRLSKRRRWARYLELVDPRFNPLWPHHTDSPEIRSGKNDQIAADVQRLVKAWNTLEVSVVRQKLSAINSAALAVTLEFYER